MIAYLDAASGISGDMFLGALVDAGLGVDTLRGFISRLNLPDPWSIEAVEVKKGPMRATQVRVHAPEAAKHRHLHHIREMIEASRLPATVVQTAGRVFERLAEAEARVHGSSVEKVHFHEVGAVDSIIDIVGTTAGLVELGVEQLYCSPLPLGAGWVDTQHGRMALPAPATLQLLAAAKAPTLAGPGDGEWVTPTGAALAATLGVFEQPAMALERVGVGAGKRDAPWPNVLRLWLGRRNRTGPMVQIETNIDDMNPQLYAPVVECLFAAGAVDVWLTPVQMKKSRPGVVLSVLAGAELEAALVQILLEQTTTLGVRVQALTHRHEAARMVREVKTCYGLVRFKVKLLAGKPTAMTPEYDDCKRLAEQHNVPVRVVMNEAWIAATHPGQEASVSP